MAGAEVLLRYRYPDGSLQAALPLRVVRDDEALVAWLAPGTAIMYWASADGSDPRSRPLEKRFTEPLTCAPRTWQGTGVLRVMREADPYQVLHFWDEDGAFVGWYVNFESPRVRVRDRLDTVDWHLDLWLYPDGTAAWKDEDEAEAAVAAGYLAQAHLDAAREAGSAIIVDFTAWLSGLGDWRAFVPPRAWREPLPLPLDWAE